MSQDQWLVLLFKVVLLAGAVSALGFVGLYWRLTRGAMWHNTLGRSIVIFDLLVVLCLTPSLLSLFFTFNRLTSHVAAWIDVVLFGLITPVMLHRCLVWWRARQRDEEAGNGS